MIDVQYTALASDRVSADHLATTLLRSFAHPRVVAVTDDQMRNLLWVVSANGRARNLQDLIRAGFSASSALSTFVTSDEVAIASSLLDQGAHVGRTMSDLRGEVGSSWHSDLLGAHRPLCDLVDALSNAPYVDDAEGSIPDLSAYGLRRTFPWFELHGFVEPVVVPCPTWHGLRRYQPETSPVIVGRHRDGGYGAWRPDESPDAAIRWRPSPDFFAQATKYLNDELVTPALASTTVPSGERAFTVKSAIAGGSRPRTAALAWRGEKGDRGVVLATDEVTMARFVRDSWAPDVVGRAAARAAGLDALGTAMPGNKAMYEVFPTTWHDFLLVASVDLGVSDDAWREVPDYVGGALLDVGDFLRTAAR